MSTDWLQVYRASMYALPDRATGAKETQFALDGPDVNAPEGAAQLQLAGAATLITAWNPDSVEQDLAWNQAANQRLADALRDAQLEFRPSYGASLPETQPAWREEGFVLYGLSRAVAARWGREWQQRALVHVDADAAGLLFCADEAFFPCGVRVLAEGRPVEPQDG